MTVDYPGCVDAIITDPNRVFVGALAKVPASDLTIVCHKTASGGPTSALALARYFQTNAEKVSSHFVVGKDGIVVQCVSLYDGAAANCCTSSGYAQAYWSPFVSKYGNLNRCTISIEHEDWTRDNSDPMPATQVDASNKLVLWLCKRYGIPTSRIKSHASIDPVNRSRCPGSTFNFNQLCQYIQSGSPNKAMVQAAQDTWNSTAFFFGGQPLNYNTGIANAWESIYLKGLIMPAPTTPEFKSVDWNGNPITVQLFSTIRCEWANGKPRWFHTTGGIM